MVLTAAERREWTHHPVTMEFLQFLRDSQQATMEAWANHEYVGESLEQGAMMNAKALGGIDVLNKAINHIEDMKEVEA